MKCVVVACSLKRGRLFFAQNQPERYKFRVMLSVFILFGFLSGESGANAKPGKPIHWMTPLASNVLSGATNLSSPRGGKFLDIRVDTRPNASPAVAYNSQHNEFLVVWEELPSVGPWEIWGQRISPDGSPRGNAIRIAFDSNYSNMQPTVAYSPQQDKYLTVYTIELDSLDHDIRGVLMDWDGSDLNNFPVDPSSGTKHRNPTLAYNQQDQEFLVVYDYWKSDTESHILARRIKAADGSLVGPPITLADGMSGQQRHASKVAYNPLRHDYLIAYNYYSTAPFLAKIMAKRISADLVSYLMKETEISNVHYPYNVSLAAGPDEYLAVWMETTSPSANFRITGRRVSGNGTLGPLIGFADMKPDSSLKPAASYSPFWGYVVIWTFDYLGTTKDILGTLLQAGQDIPLNPPFPVSYVNYLDGGFYDGQQQFAALACSPSGTCLAAYEDDCCVLNTGDFEIRGKLLTPYFLYLPLIERN